MKLDQAWQRYYSDDYPGLVARYDTMVKLVVPPSLLDVGCGQCLLGYLLQLRRPEVEIIVGVDNCEEVIEDGKRRLGGLEVELRCKDAKQLPFTGEQFSTVVLGQVLEHVDDPVPIVGEALRVLRGGGRLIASVPVELTRSKAHKRVFHDVGELKVLFDNHITWCGGMQLHRWYFAWGDKR